jgi:lysophospholipase L1-like esterase
LKLPSRRTALRLVAVTIGFLPILLVELGLRFAGIAADMPTENPTHSQLGGLTAIDTDPLLGLHALRPLFVPTGDGTRMEIAAERMNYFCPASFPIKKNASTLRIFALGGSTTQGQPYRTETAFAHWLSLRLEAALPDREIEVVNCGGISYASYRVAAILNEVLNYSPDLILLYTGHNEFLEARTYERQRRVPRWLAGPLAMVNRLRIARVLANALSDNQHFSKSAVSAEVDTMLDHADGMDAYQRDDEWSDGVHVHFEMKLAEMVAACQSASVPLVLCMPASDIVNTPPFKSTPEPSLNEALQTSVKQWTRVAESESEPIATRVDAAESILNVDPKHALANYALGRLAYELEKTNDTEMLPHLIAARDHDVCPLRATTRIESAVRSHRDILGVIFVDVLKVFDQRNASGEGTPDGAADPRWFVDHVHPTIEGHQAIATAIYGQLLAANWITPAENADETYAAKVEAHLKTLGEEYYGRAKQRLDGVKRWSRRLR